MMYLTGASNADVIHAAAQHHIGIILNPESGYEKQVCQYPAWAADNGCYSQGERFNLSAWLDWIERLQVHRQSCLFVVAPDVFHPSGYWQGITIAQATLERSLPVLPTIREMGFKAALVAQNGLEHEQIPWGAFDALFIGGDTSWKLSPMALLIAREAKARSKHVHMGRVNSARRYRIAAQMGCDSCDGTYLKYGPDVNLPRLARWVA
jgi:hypothetical protein